MLKREVMNPRVSNREMDQKINIVVDNYIRQRGLLIQHYDKEIEKLKGFH